MLLFEFEGLELFDKCGIKTPRRQLLESKDPSTPLGMTGAVVLKVQVLSGKRAEGGGIVIVKGKEESLPAGKAGVKGEVEKLFQKTVNGEKVTRILVEEMVEFEKEYYLSFSYDTQSRGAIFTFGEGGTGAEGKGATSYPVDIIKGYRGENIPAELQDTAIKLWEVFTKYDCELAEINPLVISSVIPSEEERRVEESSQLPTVGRDDKLVYALDAKVILDDDADFRREVKFPERNLFGRAPTEAEVEARKIDEGDHRGTAGSVYWDLDGDIAVLAAGGGGSVVNMDALIACGGRPANYTEHSGNPPREKLKKLTKIILSKPGLKGLWIVGGTANFTDIYETLSGVIEGLREVNPKPKFPIVIRRGGPRDEEAFAMLKEVAKNEGFDLHIYGRETPMTSTAKIMVDLAYGKEVKVTSNK